MLFLSTVFWGKEGKVYGRLVTNHNFGKTYQKRQQEYLEFQEYFLKTTMVEIGTISIEGRDKDPVNYFYMTVYVRTINGETISLRQSITRTNDEIDRKTKIPKALQHLSNHGKILNERKSTQENNRMKELILR